MFVFGGKLADPKLQSEFLARETGMASEGSCFLCVMTADMRLAKDMGAGSEAALAVQPEMALAYKVGEVAATASAGVDALLGRGVRHETLLAIQLASKRLKCNTLMR